MEAEKNKSTTRLLAGFNTPIILTSSNFIVILEDYASRCGVLNPPDIIKKDVLTYIGRGVTIFYGEGGYTGEKQRTLFCVLNRRELAIARDIVRDIDPAAFVIFTDVYDVMGDGFKPRNIELTEKKRKSR